MPRISHSKVDRIVIPKMTTEFKNVRAVSPEVRKCFPEVKIYQTVHDYLIVLPNCTALVPLNVSKNWNRTSEASQQAEQLNFLFVRYQISAGRLECG